jgi:hypothetical protein
MKILNIINNLTTPIRTIWHYFVDMNSEKGGGVSIKRNMAWGIGTLVFIIQLYSLTRLPCVAKDEIIQFVYICIFYSTSDLIFILLALGITSLEKISDLVQRIKGGIIERVQTTKVEDKKIEQTENTQINKED